MSETLHAFALGPVILRFSADRQSLRHFMYSDLPLANLSVIWGFVVMLGQGAVPVVSSWIASVAFRHFIGSLSCCWDQIPDHAVKEGRVCSAHSFRVQPVMEGTGQQKLEQWSITPSQEADTH